MSEQYPEVGQTEEWNIAVSYTYQIVGHISKILEYKVAGQLEQSYNFMKSLYHLVKPKMEEKMRVEFDEEEDRLDCLMNHYRDMAEGDCILMGDARPFMKFFDETMIFLEKKGLITPKGDDPMSAWKGGRR